MLESEKEKLNPLIHQQKMGYIETSLKQLMNLQKKLVEQNSKWMIKGLACLKNEITVAEQQLAMRNERISKLESLVLDSESQLTKQVEMYQGELSRLNQHQINVDWVKAAKIAKPLRGGQEIG